MRLATCGGETGWRCFVLAHLAAEWLDRGKPALIIDATPEQELIKHLDVSPSLMSRLPRLGEEGFRVKEYVRGTVRASAITECSEPTPTSRHVGYAASDPFLNCFSAELAYPPLHTRLREGSARLISLGSSEATDIHSLQRHHQALSILLNHLADEAHDGVFIHLPSGRLPCITGILGRVDLAVLVQEQPSSGNALQERDAITAIRQTLDRFKTPTVYLSTEMSLPRDVTWYSTTGWHREPSKVTMEAEALVQVKAALQLPGAKESTVALRDAVRTIIDHALNIPRDPARFARNNRMMESVSGQPGLGVSLSA